MEAIDEMEEMAGEGEENSFSNITQFSDMLGERTSTDDDLGHLHAVHSIIMTMKPASRQGKLKPTFRVNLASLSKEILDKIVGQLEPEETMMSIKTLGRRFHEISYEVLSTELRNIGPTIYGQLEDSKDEVMTLPLNVDLVKEFMFKMAHFAFLEILNGEYNLLCCIYLDREGYISRQVLTYQIIDNLNEFNSLLRDSADGKLNWEVLKVNDAINKIRLLNQKAFEMFFMRCWNRKRDHFGPLLMKLLNCAINSNFRITLCHEAIPRRVDAKCYITAQYEIADEISTGVPPFFLMDLDRHEFLKLFLLFICSSIRIQNLRETLKLRRECLDLLTKAKEDTLDWDWFGNHFPYVDSLPILVSEHLHELPNGAKKRTRVIEKPGESLSNTPNWKGMRFDFQLWCPVIDAPIEFFRQDYLENLYSLAYLDIGYGGEGEVPPPVDPPYGFKLDFKLFGNAVSEIQHSEALVEHCIWIKESALDIHISKGKHLIS